MNAHAVERSSQRRGSKPKRSRTITLACWASATGVAVIATAWLGSGWSWSVDLIANLNAQWAIGGIAVALICLALRRWSAAALALAAVGMLMIPLLLGRAAWLPRPIEIARPQLRSPDLIRVLHYNARSRGTHDGYLALFDETDPDIVSLVGPGLDGQFRVIYGNGLEDRFPGKMVRPWSPGSAEDGAEMVSAAYLVARWPIRAMDLGDLGEAAEQILAGVVDRPPPAGPFGVIALHPRSPRTKYRWVRGNLTVDAAVEVARRMQLSGLPVLLISDLNSTPSGYRSRQVTNFGLRRAKPLFECAGTYPEEVPIGLSLKSAWSLPTCWPGRIAIDDVWISPDVVITGWSVLPATGSGSEHRPILVDLRCSTDRHRAGSEKQPTNGVAPVQ